MNERSRLATLSQFASGEERYNWRFKSHQMSLQIRMSRQLTTACKIVIYRRFQNTLSDLVLLVSEDQVVLKIMIIFVKSFELKLSFSFIEAKSIDIGMDL